MALLFRGWRLTESGRERLSLGLTVYRLYPLTVCRALADCRHQNLRETYIIVDNLRHTGILAHTRPKPHPEQDQLCAYTAYSSDPRPPNLLACSRLPRMSGDNQNEDLQDLSANDADELKAFVAKRKWFEAKLKVSSFIPRLHTEYLRR
jgi:hypothetical protein